MSPRRSGPPSLAVCGRHQSVSVPSWRDHAGERRDERHGHGRSRNDGFMRQAKRLSIPGQHQNSG
eukprot:3179172-Pyramimonas_sp.AAC.1